MLKRSVAVHAVDDLEQGKAFGTVAGVLRDRANAVP
jgi:hypothetical protein